MSSTPILSISIPADLLRAIDRAVKAETPKGKRTNRSAWIQRAVQKAVEGK